MFRSGLILSISLFVLFGYRYAVKTRKFMPSGLLAVASLVVLAVMFLVMDWTPESIDAGLTYDEWLHSLLHDAARFHARLRAARSSGQGSVAVIVWSCRLSRSGRSISARCSASHWR